MITLRALLLITVILCIGCSKTKEARPAAILSYTEAIKVAIDRFEKEQWGQLQHFDIEYCPCEDESVWIVMFYPNLHFDEPVEPGIELAIVVDRKTRETTVIQQ